MCTYILVYINVCLRACMCVRVCECMCIYNYVCVLCVCLCMCSITCMPLAGSVMSNERALAIDINK